MRAVIFDLDGVLVDVTDSYRETVIQAVKSLTGSEITREEKQQRKNRCNSDSASRGLGRWSAA